MIDAAKVREEILEAGKRLRDRFFVAANDGNISACLPGGGIVITPTGVNKGDMSAEMLLTVDAEGNVLSGSLKPSSEMKMHLAVYQQRPDVLAIVHAHPPTATGFATSRIRLDQDVILPEVVFGLGRIGFSEYGTPTTHQVPETVSREIADCDALLLANHGALTVGTSVMQAYYRMETLEMYARIRMVTMQLGGPAALSEPEIEELFQVRAQRGWGRSPGLEVDPRAVELISQIVLQVLQTQGVGSQL
ncbi:MAG: class II aldolase/adducin family protein [Spirochaetaceae bacterium]|nr:MAG: class II aldolase/adducin family protein [Spirochaetaceae bacterium]